MPKITFGFVMSLDDSSAQKLARSSVVAASLSEALPMMLPEDGCIEGSL